MTVLGKFGKLVGVTALVASPAVVVLGTSPAGAATQVTFTTVGTSSWSVPEGVSCVNVDAIGAAGGTFNQTTAAAATAFNGGARGVGAQATNQLGGEAVSDLPVLPGQVLQVNVGGRGGDSVDSNTGTVPGGVGGFNGGGKGGGGLDTDPQTGLWAGGSGGGGASDVRQNGTDLANRVVVGGGGGGTGPNINTGGDGGGDPGDDGSGGTLAGKGATGSAGGAGGTSAGSASNGGAGVLGAGGSGAEATDLNVGGGGGGGGLYGGGGGGGAAPGQGLGGGGGGGSGLGDTMTNGVDAGNDGNGKVTLSYTPGDTSCLLAPLTITKVTTGATPAAGTTFTLHLACTPGDIDTRPFGPGASSSAQDFTFTVDGSGVVRPAGGYVVGFTDPDQCTVTETDAGGAISTTYACVGTPGTTPRSTGARTGDWVSGQATSPPLCSAAGPQADPITVGINTPDQSVTVTVTNAIAAPAPAPAVTIMPKFTG